MKIISHRGNIRGPVEEKENRPSYIDCAIGSGYDVEIDLRLINGELWLGHDKPQYKIDHNWLNLRKEYLWIHCKNIGAAKECWQYRSFCHSQDSFVYTSNGKIWLHDLAMEVDGNVIIPLITACEMREFILTGKKPYGICTDYPCLL
jgi:hypothetical protein